ncbi:MAG: MFS transporter [Candidatus Asgardarchaeia archaeon]
MSHSALFKRLLVANFLVNFSVAIAYLYFPIILYYISNKNELYIAYLWLLTDSSWVFTQILFGFIGDKLRWRSFIAALLAIIYALFLLSFFVTTSPFLLLILLSIGFSILAGYYVNVNSLGTLLKEEEHGTAIGFISSIYALSSFFGNAAGSILVLVDPTFKLIYLVAFISALSAAIALKPIVATERKLTYKIKVALQTVRGGYISLLKDVRITLIIIATILMNICTTFLWAYTGVYYVDFLKGSYFLYGMYNSLIAIISVVISPILGKLSDDKTKGLPMVFGYTFVTLSLYAFGILTVLDPVVILFFISFPFYAGYSIAIFTVVSDITSEENRSRATGIVHSSENVGSALGSALIIWLLTMFSFSILRDLVTILVLHALWIAMVVVILLSILLQLIKRSTQPSQQ